MKVLQQIKSLEKTILKNSISVNDLQNQKIDCRITPVSTQMEIIEYILEHSDEEIYQKDLEDVLQLKRATISGVLQTMEKNKVIERVIAEKDTRTKRIVLNENAKQVYLKNYEKIQEMERKVIKDISVEDLNTFLNVIEKMKKNICD